jgi:hypothetical protein
MIGQLVNIPICSSGAVANGPAGELVCTGGTWSTVNGFLLDASQQPQLTVLLENGGIDWETVEWMFFGGLSLFVAGAGVGLIINVLRRLK